MTKSELPLAKDHTHFFSQETRARKPSPLKTCIHLFNDPNIIFLGGGLPLSDYFPWDNISIDSPLPPFNKGIGASPSGSTEDTCKILVQKDSKPSEGDIPLARSLQYGFTPGQPELIKFLKDHTELIHTMRYSDWDLILTTGNTHGWESTLRIFCDRGDTILAEAHSFSSSLAAAEAQGITVFPVPIDNDGIIPEKLEAILDNWNPAASKPKLLYTIPTGQNPTGTSLSDARKTEIYRIACKHDFLIIEDEPYYFLQMPKYEKDTSKRSNQQNDTKLSHKEFLGSLAQTFLSLDTEGRVIRMDSFSKVLAPGTRIGWLTGSAKLLKAYVSLNEMTSQSCAGFAQSIVSGLLNRWGQEGYLDWLIGLRHEYTLKRDCAIDALYEYIPQNKAFAINPPIAGMFFTVGIDASAHPKFATKYNSNPHELETAIYEKVIKSGVLVVPGSWFKTDGETEPPQPKTSKQVSNVDEIFFRGTYAAVEPEKLKEGLRRLGATLYEEFGLTK